MSRDPRNLESVEIVREIHSVRDEMDRLAARMVELSQALYSKVRRAPADDYTGRYVTFANAWTRFGSMVDGGLRRTSSVSRLVETIRREQAEAEEHAEREARLADKRAAREAETSASPDLVELYGQEMVSHAAR